MNPSSAVRFSAASRPVVLISAALLLTAGALTAAPTPKPTPSPAATPVSTPAAKPTASPVASATPVVQAKYNGAQQSEYIKTAVDAFVALRQAQQQPYLDANTEFANAGGVNAKGLTSKEAITSRRNIIAKCIEGNETYLNFIKTQVDTYRAELSKTPLVPGDVDTIADDFAKRANTDALVKLRENEREVLKTGDAMMAFLEKSYGSWTVSDEGKLTFKKKSALGAYPELSQKFNTLAKAGQAMRDTVNTALAVPSASAPPTAVPGATASPTATASPAASAKPTPTATPAH